MLRKRIELLEDIAGELISLENARLLLPDDGQHAPECPRDLVDELVDNDLGDVYVLYGACAAGYVLGAAAALGLEPAQLIATVCDHEREIGRALPADSAARNRFGAALASVIDPAAPLEEIWALLVARGVVASDADFKDFRAAITSVGHAEAFRQLVCAHNVGAVSRVVEELEAHTSGPFVSGCPF